MIIRLFLFCVMGTALWGSLGSSDALEISAQGVLVQKYRLQLIAQNVANAFTMRTERGIPYVKKFPIVESKGDQVWVSGVGESQEPFGKAYDPSHPFSDKYGFVHIPNVNLAEEMVDLSYTNVLYEANTTVFKSARSMVQSTLDILK